MGENKRPKRSNLKKMLHELNMSQIELAEKADLETYQISNYVNGKFDDFLMSTGVKICEVLHCTFDEAFGDKVSEMKLNIRKERDSIEPQEEYEEEESANEEE